MVLGGLKEGVTPLGWAYAYSTIGNNGDHVSGTLAPRPGDSPVAFTQVTDKDGKTIKGGDNDSLHNQVFEQGTAEEAEEHPRNGRLQRHRDQGADRRRRPVGQDRDDREQRRRLVLRWRRRRSHRLRLGRLPEHDDADDDPLQRRPGDGRHLPGADLGQRDQGLGGNPGRARGRKARAASRAGKPVAPNSCRKNRPANTCRKKKASKPRPKKKPRLKAKRRPRPKRPVEAWRWRPVAVAAAASPPVNRRRCSTRSRPRDEAAAGGAEAPGPLDRFGDPDPRAGHHLGRLALGWQQQERVAVEAGGRSASRPMPSASVSLPGPEQRSASGRGPRRRAHRLQAGGRLQRPDQHRRRLALGFADDVEQAVDPVGEVDVGAAGRAEQDLGARGQADVGVAGGIVAVVALGLDDRAAATVEEEPAADQLTGDVVDAAVEEVDAESLGRRRSRALFAHPSPRPRPGSRERCSIWAARGTEPVPPAIRFDSSQLPRFSTS